MAYKILILWWRGMLGSTLCTYLIKQWCEVDITVSSWWKKNEFVLRIDSINYISDLENILRKSSYDYVINCIASLQGNIENPKDVMNCFLVNIHLPKILDLNAKKFGYKYIHISTNGVFASGDRPYSDIDIPNDTTLYWLSKFAGESMSESTMILRTSIIGFDPYGSKGLLEWVLWHKDQAKIYGYTNVYWNGITTLTLAHIIFFLISTTSFPTGIIHITWETFSKKEIIELISQVFEKNLVIITNTDRSENRTILPSLIQKKFQHLIPSLKIQLEDLKIFKLI